MDPEEDRRLLQELLNEDIVRALLSLLLDQRDRQSSANRETVRDLILKRPDDVRGALRPLISKFFEPQRGGDEQVWKEVEDFARSSGLFEIVPARKAPGFGEPLWLNSRVRWLVESEPRLRKLLGRPLKITPADDWERAVAAVAADCRALSQLLELPLAVPAGFARPAVSAIEAYVDCWASIPKILQSAESITWRQLSALAFNGDSKFLEASETRLRLCREMFPELVIKLKERPLLVHIHLPADLCQVLFVENQDTFLALAVAPPPSTAIVYSQGFKGTARRLRDRDSVVFCSLGSGHGTGDNLEAFKSAWFAIGSEQHQEPSLPVLFWGDLDYAGLSIAARLRVQFPHLQCWVEGYGPMVAELKSGGGHLPIQAGKQNQAEPCGEALCEYGREILLPVLQQTGRFVDQEWSSVGA
ncbi:hypothetical protein [Microbulbifer discodermiae]|uniref:hypothetical protein n=1 Tax=Microbulbifer sp. 2201CG32-9 TaxID=3232309 RepID=UPI00345C5B2C